MTVHIPMFVVVVIAAAAAYCTVGALLVAILEVEHRVAVRRRVRNGQPARRWGDPTFGERVYMATIWPYTLWLVVKVLGRRVRRRQGSV